MVHFARELADEANSEWLPNFIDYAKLKKIVHKYKDVRYSTRQVLMITVTSYGIIIHMPAQLKPSEKKEYVIGKDLRPLKDQLQVLKEKVDENHEIERDRLEKIENAFNKIELDPDKQERQRARQARHDKMRQLFGSEELLEVEEIPSSSGNMRVVAQMIARSSVCTKHFFLKLNKELSKVNKFFIKQEGRFLQRHLLLMKQSYLLKMQNKFTKRKLKTLKTAFKEHYKTLELLQRFRKLNHEGFKRIIKKYQKYTKNEVKKYYYDILNNQYFQTSEVLDKMRHQSEQIAEVILYPDKGHKNAMNKLKLPPSSMTKKQINTSFHTGFWLGASALFTVVWIVYYVAVYIHIEPKVDALRSSASMYLYRLMLFPILLLFFIGVDVRVWNLYHVNYVFIFELNPRKHISEMQLLRVPLIGYCIWCVSYMAFMMSTVIDYHNNDNIFGGLSWISVIVLYGFLLFWILNPLPFFYRASRYWLVNTLWRIALAPFYRVTFRDFWLADQLCSMGTFLFEMQFLLCIATSSIQQAYGSTSSAFCNTYTAIGIPILNLWPFYARFMQCARRFVDTRQITHLWNCGKYMSSMIVIIIFMFDSNLFPPTDGRWSSIRTAWFIANYISMWYKIVWDLYMDWGLIRGFRKDENGKRARYPLLRHELLFRHWVYYIAMVSDVALRHVWIALLVLRIFFPDFMQLIWIGFLTAAIELFRRGMWNIFRLENEHLTNVGQFRVTRDIPLPFENYQPSADTSSVASKTWFEKFIATIAEKIFCCFNFTVHKSLLDMEFESDEEENKEPSEDHDTPQSPDSNEKYTTERVRSFSDSDEEYHSQPSRQHSFRENSLLSPVQEIHNKQEDYPSPSSQSKESPHVVVNVPSQVESRVEATGSSSPPHDHSMLYDEEVGEDVGMHEAEIAWDENDTVKEARQRSRSVDQQSENMPADIYETERHLDQALDILTESSSQPGSPQV